MGKKFMVNNSNVLRSSKSAVCQSFLFVSLAFYYDRLNYKMLEGSAYLKEAI